MHHSWNAKSPLRVHCLPEADRITVDACGAVTRDTRLRSGRSTIDVLASEREVFGEFLLGIRNLFKVVWCFMF